MDEEALTNFMSITGADAATAQQYLELTAWKIEEAVNLFMESGGSGTSGNTTGGASAGSTFDPYIQQDVRAPDPSKRQRLVGGDLDGHGAIPHPAQFFGRGSNFNQFSSTPHNPNGLFQRDYAAETIASINAMRGGPGSSRFSIDTEDMGRRENQGLSQLFQPPVGLMFHGTLAEARNLAKQESKWLLVNVQDETVFASLRLNRDTWSDDFVQNLVSSGFVFWQSYATTDQGKKFCALYQVDTGMLPVICILDPRTGQKIVEWHDFIEPQNLTEKLSDFCCLNSLDGGPVAAPPAPAAVSRPVVRERTEDEELAAAIAASLEHNDDDDDDNDIEVDVGEEEKEEEKVAAFVPLPDEPADGPLVTRVQIRTTVGTRLMRRFYKSDPVSILWQFVQQEIPESRSRGFELRTSYPPAAVALADHSLTDAKLENASLMMQWT
ncbi:Aste57867_21229 [Aphanomyces stellatus]|uniref:Aste57867_21229 protein n=1 Tax=Aphanomyces stellatus TaxID=120398 RepID=A0A485LGY8_9STRA|nr:hypothetical protein As57867_021161 [Aphanomyces stellatus]VFT97901.1 Aste57867_21229 [Aphanomyces stellatus]